MNGKTISRCFIKVNFNSERWASRLPPNAHETQIPVCRDTCRSMQEDAGGFRSYNSAPSQRAPDPDPTRPMEYLPDASRCVFWSHLYKLLHCNPIGWSYHMRGSEFHTSCCNRRQGSTDPSSAAIQLKVEFFSGNVRFVLSPPHIVKMDQGNPCYFVQPCRKKAFSAARAAKYKDPFIDAHHVIPSILKTTKQRKTI